MIRILPLLFLLICLAPVGALAMDCDDECEVDEEEDGVSLEVEGKGNHVIVIEELVININAGDIGKGGAGGDGDALSLLHQLMMKMHGGGQPGQMSRRQMSRQGMRQMGPDGAMGRGMGHGMGENMGHGMGENMGHGMGMMPEGHGMGMMQQGHGMKKMPQGHGPETTVGPPDRDARGRQRRSPDQRMRHNPEVRKLLRSVPADIDPDFLRFILHIGKVAWDDPKFREALHELARDHAGDGATTDMSRERDHSGGH